MFATPKQSGLLGRTSISSASSAYRTTPISTSRPVRAEQVLEETSQYVVKALNSPVPVQVQEALRGDTRTASIKLHDSGWAWLVTGNKLLLWKFSTSHFTAQCKQISLPPSSAVIAKWNADLVTICSLPGTNDTQVAMVAASPEGKVYYWSDALRDVPSFLEGSADVGEGYSFMLSSLEGSAGCLLATTRGDLFLVLPPLLSQGGLVIRQLHVPRGMLSGFGRRVSSLFFSTQVQDIQQTRRLETAYSEASQKDIAFVLTNTNLQKWHIADPQEQMMYDASLGAMVKDAVVQNGWFADVGSSGQRSLFSASQLSLWVVDMQLTNGFVAVLFAVSMEGNSSAEYGLALIQLESDVTPLTVDQLIRLNHSISYRAGGEAPIQSLCLHGAPFSSTVMAHHRNTILLVDLKSAVSTQSVDVVNFPHPNGIIGSGTHDMNLLFFTLNQGVVSIACQSGISGFAHRSRPASIVGATPTIPSQGIPPMMSSHMSREESSDNAEALKNAFMQYLEHHTERAVTTCEQLFPPDSFAPRVDTPCDLAVVRLSELVINELPASDPRWGEAGRDTSTSGSSLIIIYQLEDKLEAHNRYLRFLTDIGLLDKLTCVTVEGRPVSTPQLLCEHAEKIVASITLRKRHNQIVDQAIKLALQQRPSPLPTVHPGPTNQDIFYSNVSSVDDILPALISQQDNMLHALGSPQERLQVILNVAAIIEAMIHDAIQYRHSQAVTYQPCLSTDSPEVEFIPWTGSTITRSCISQQLQTLLDLETMDQSVWSLVFQLCDLLFDGYKSQIDSLEKSLTLGTRITDVRRSFETDRQRFLMPLLECGQYHLAEELGEKYEDFGVLVQLCERQNNKGKLREYMTRFSTQGFSDFLFKQYLDQGKLKQLLSYSEEFPADLEKFLEPHDNLSWIHHLSCQDYTKAYETLHRLADKESKYVAKKKTLLSLSKLAMLASDCPDSEKAASLEHLNNKLEVVEYQQNLPMDALEECGLDSSMPPLPPEETIELYIGDKNPCSDEHHFLLALEFLDFAYPDRSSNESQELRVYIWSQAILKDDWSQLSTDDPLGQLQMTFFFKLAEEGYNKGLDLLSLLPDLSALLNSKALVEVGLVKDPSFQFLIKAGYEQIERATTVPFGDSFVGVS